MSEDTLRHEGRLIPASIGLSHIEQLERLAEGCPEAVPLAFIAGDPCYDRMLASLSRRLHYRKAFHLRPGQRLITVASTWREDSLFGIDPLLVSRMLAELPYDQYRIALILHPNVWASHSEFQIKAWMAGAQRAGLIIIPREEGWRAALVASDYVLSDHGSAGIYAAALGRPVLLDKSAMAMIDPRSALGRLLDVAQALDPLAAFAPQLRLAENSRDRTHAVAKAWISSAPERSLHLIRDELCRIMGTPPPSTTPTILALDSPVIDDVPPASLWTHIEQVGAHPGELSVRRVPAAGSRPAEGVLIVADQELDHRLCGQADIIRITRSALPASDKEWSDTVFEHRPGAGLTLAHDDHDAVLRTRDGHLTLLALDEIDDPLHVELVFAVLAERLLTGTDDLAVLNPLTLHPGPVQAIRARFRVRVH